MYTSYILIIYFLLLQFNLLLSSPLSKKNLKKNKRKLAPEESVLSDDIVIIHINDVHCGLNDTVGYDGFALYREELKKQYKNVISVDVGDHVQGGTLGAISDGEAIINIINEIGFDVSILGNHEFDYGIEQLEKLKGEISSNYISANFCYKKTNEPVFEPYKIIQVVTSSGENKKIAFIGLTTPLTFSKTYLSTLKEDGDYIYDFLSSGNKLYETTQNYINEVRNEENVDYVILLTHFGMKIEEYTSDFLLSKLEGVDAILDGHTHKIYNELSKDKNQNEIYIAQTGTKLESIGILILKANGTIISKNINEIPEPTDKTNAIKINRGKKERWVDKKINEYINTLWDSYKDELNEIFGNLNFDIIVKPEDNGDSHTIFCRYKECSLGDLISDAIRDAGNGEISILNGGGVRNSLKKGIITRAKVIDTLPWFNNIVVKELSGQDILDALEFGVSKFPQVSGGFPQVSGITFKIDDSFESTVETDSNGIFISVKGKRRVWDVKINGNDLDVNRIYNASLLEFIAAGGDGYSMLAKNKVINESLITDTDAVAFYIKNNLEGNIPEIFEKEQGRIIFKVKSNDDEENKNGGLFLKIYRNFLIMPFLTLIYILL